MELLSASPLEGSRKKGPLLRVSPQKKWENPPGEKGLPARPCHTQMTEKGPLFMFLVLTLTYLGLAARGEKKAHATRWGSTPAWEKPEKLLSKKKILKSPKIL